MEKICKQCKIKFEHDHPDIVRCDYCRGKYTGKRETREGRKKRRAYNSVRSALRKKRLVRQEICEKCGSIGGTHAHHHLGYGDEQLLSVTWLCPACHRKEHIIRKEA